jgi:hypothetical protein
MTELLSALIGALVGGTVSAAAVIWQTQRVLRHEVLQAREAREAAVREARSDLERQAAVNLLQALTVYSVPSLPPNRDWREWFAGPTTADVHGPRRQRVAELKRLTDSEAELLPRPLFTRWEHLAKSAAYVTRLSDLEGQALTCHAMDLRSLAEWARSGLVALINDQPPGRAYPLPDFTRADDRVWGWKPPAGADEPDLTDWIKEWIEASNPG